VSGSVYFPGMGFCKIDKWEREEMKVGFIELYKRSAS
jgi:hypothetical protein